MRKCDEYALRKSIREELIAAAHRILMARRVGGVGVVLDVWESPTRTWRGPDVERVCQEEYSGLVGLLMGEGVNDAD